MADKIVTCVSMGNPHCITYVDDVKTLDLSKIGTVFENNEMFPNRVNTEFIHIISGTEFDMRVMERGSGENRLRNRSVRLRRGKRAERLLPQKYRHQGKSHRRHALYKLDK